MSGSEITRIREQIADEYVAATRSLEEYSLIVRHLFIIKRMEAIGRYSEVFRELVEDEEAGRIVIDVLEKA